MTLLTSKQRVQVGRGEGPCQGEWLTGSDSRGVAHGEWLTSIVSGIRSGGRIERLTSPAGWLALYQLAT